MKECIAGYNLEKYKVVSIVGAQSSGKSTLMNVLYQTKFKVLDSVIERKQTTQGVWMDVVGDNVLFDSEGSDSTNRWGSQNFERYVGLFVLTLSDVLIINVWINDIGRYQSSQYDLLQNVFRHQLKIWGSQFRKTLIFVVRDYDQRYENAQNIRGVLTSDINKIWKSITLIQFEGVFDLHIHFVSNLRGLALDNTNRELQQLRQMIGESNYHKNVSPFKSLHSFCAHIWDTIIKQKDFNLPESFILISKYQCNQAKCNILKVINYYDQIDHLSLSKYQEEKIKISNLYQNETKDYQKRVQQEILNELLNEFHQVQRDIYIQDIQRLQDQVISKLNIKIIKEIETQQNLNVEFINQLQIEFIKQYSDKIDFISQIVGQELLSIILFIIQVKYNQSFKQNIYQFMYGFKSQILIQLRQELIQRKEIELKDQLDKLYLELPIDIFQQQDRIYINIIQQSRLSLINISRLINDQINEKQIDNKIMQIQEYLMIICEKYKSKFEQYVQDKFIMLFTKDHQGQRIKWQQYTEQQIKHNHNELIKQLEQIIDNQAITQQNKNKIKSNLSHIAQVELEDALKIRAYQPSMINLYLILFLAMAYLVLDKFSIVIIITCYFIYKYRYTLIHILNKY